VAVTEPLSSETLKEFLSTIRVGEVRTGRVLGIEDREVLVELDGFSGPRKAVGRIPCGDLTRKAIEPSLSFAVGYQVKPNVPVTAGVAHRPSTKAHSSHRSVRPRPNSSASNLASLSSNRTPS
jgi:hypothetical protein